MKAKLLCTLTAFLLILLACFHARAATEYDAESLYKAALGYYQANDFRNTLRSVHLAKDLYSSLQDNDGVVKCNQLITKVSEILTVEQMADYYYDIAGSYLTEENPTLSSYINAKEFAGYAQDYYQRAGDADGTLKSEDFINRAQRQINDLRTQKQQTAYTYYRMAQDSYSNNQYPKARIYALNASIIYNDIFDTDGISTVSSLISVIDAKINQTRFNALASYDRALDYYAQKDYDNALKYASISQQLFTSIEDMDGVTRATNLVSQVNKEHTDVDEQKLRLAQTYYDRAGEMLIIQNYVNATDFAQSSREIYMEFYLKWAEQEKNLGENERTNTKLYGSYIAKVDNLIERINSEWGADRKKQQAETFYTTAMGYYTDNQLEASLNYAQRAKNYFSDLNDYIGVNKCDALIQVISGRMAEKRQGDAFYEQAYGFYFIAEFENALLYAGKARNIYVKISDSSSAERVDNLTTQINDGIKLRDDANTYYQQADGYFNAGDYENARTLSLKAFNIYSQINYTLGVANSGLILNQSSIKIEEAYVNLRNTVLTGLIIIVVGAYLILSRRKEQKSLTSTLKKEKEKMQEEKVIEEKQWAIRSEEETKEKVEEELRRLIEQERGAGPEEPKK
jgi:hypothetical protein